MSDYTINVTAADLATGVAGACGRCPVALALRRDARDGHAEVYEDWGIVRIELHGRSIIAPEEVQDFVHAFDDLPRRKDGLVARKAIRRKTARFDIVETLPGPFTFTLPPLNDPKWEERCCNCGEHVPQGELDDDSECEECRDDE